MVVAASKSKLPNSSLKILDYISLFLHKPDTRKFISEIRNKYQIPEGGFLIDEEEREYNNTHPFVRFPRKSIYFENGKKFIEMMLEVSDYTTSRITIEHKSILQYILIFILFNIEDLSFNKEVNSGFVLESSIKIVDLTKEINEKSTLLPELFEDRQIALLLHPDISGRDLRDFINKNWKVIEFYLQKYRKSESILKNKRVRKTDAKLRDNIILENPELSDKKLKSLLSKNGIVIGISELNTKRRELSKKIYKV